MTDHRGHRSAMTLMELLVVLAVIVLLIGIVLPAVIQARESARVIQCRNHLKQIGIAVQSYIELYQTLPQTYFDPSVLITTDSDSWSIHGHLLPFLDNPAGADALQLSIDWTDPVNQATGVSQQHYPFYTCPSDPNGSTILFQGSRDGYVYPVNYGFNYGKWLVYDPVSKQGGDGCFMRNGDIRPSDISDGLSNTLCAAEVKAFQSCIENTLDPGPRTPRSNSTPARYALGSNTLVGQTLSENDGHSEWCEGLVHQSGFTTTYTPNEFVPYTHTDGRVYDVDWVTVNEGASFTQPTYAAVTSRSYHGAFVNTLLMDGSARVINARISTRVWHCLGSRAGGEIISEY